MKFITRFQLSFMMFLEYFIWGAWYVTVSTYLAKYLDASPVQIGAAYTALAIATMISPVFVGTIADKYFSAQKVMGFLHITGAVLLYLMTFIGDADAFFWAILVYSLLYMPTIALSNNIAFYQLSDTGKQFPAIRVFGTVGWIVSGVLNSWLHFENTVAIFYLAAGVSLFLGIFSLSLPNTPPKPAIKSSVAQSLGMDALVLLKDRAYLIFFIAAVLICIPLSFYYEQANLFLNDVGMQNVSAKMVLGQASEAIFILAIPFLFYRIGVKNMLILGMFAWVLRYVCFAYGDVDANVWMLYAGIVLHGVCYDFFFVTGYMYTENKAHASIKNAAQGLFTFATYGAGMVIGTWFSGLVAHYYMVDQQHQWIKIWMVPVYIALVVLVFFIFFFKDKSAAATQQPTE
ncbi:MFS transporter [Chitinophaga caeni]|uniref:MFS transporter n=1 Tax=Chitinophaga caeni TaxID=2029983 RepID=A0A291R0I7_9BACT|nr:nucleoside permease [Chitinophaga caeni]ATL49708.1 MFS transporter [Chitinophaga caeni]